MIEMASTVEPIEAREFNVNPVIENLKGNILCFMYCE